MSVVYPLKVFMTRKKSRTLLFKTRVERDLMLKAVLAEQGFENQLEQYTVLSSHREDSSEPICFGVHFL